MPICFLSKPLVLNTMMATKSSSLISLLFSVMLLSNNAWSQEPALPEQDTQNHNQAPIAINDKASTTPNKTVTITVLDNDSDPDNDILTITQHTTAENGVVEQQGTAFLYTPNANFIGTDSFDYTISDGKFTETMATATSTAIAVLSPEGDFTDTDTFTFVINDNEGGEAIADADGTATISRTPEDMPNSTETFTFTLSNADDGEAIATATATASVSTDDASATANATAIAVNTPTESFVDTETFTYTLARNNTTAEADSIAEAEIVYAPADHRFSYSVLNPQGEEVTATAIAMAMAAASATVTAMTAATATVSIDVKREKPSFSFANTHYQTTSDAGKVQVPAWITQATDGMGGTQRPDAGDNAEPIYFYVTSNSNPTLFNKQPWLSHPSHSLHFRTKADTHGSAEICAKAVTRRGHGIDSDILCFTLTISAKNLPVPIVIPASVNHTTPTNNANIDTENTTPSTTTVTNDDSKAENTNNTDPAPITTGISDINIAPTMIGNNAQVENTTPIIPTMETAVTSHVPITPAIPEVLATPADTNTTITTSNSEGKNITTESDKKGSGGSLDVFVLVFLASLVFLRKRYNLLKINRI